MLHFVLIGINYKKTDAATRGLFSIDEEKNISFTTEAKIKGIDGIIIVSTCNRTEIYATTENTKLLKELFSKYANVEYSILNKNCYIKYEEEAIQHLFEVGAGLDSQILGDYEIVGQLKKSFQIAKKNYTTNSFLERLFNTVLQSTKSIKQETKLSSGTISVSFAVVQSILHQLKDVKHKNILLIGTGKIGHITCKNIIDYIQPLNFAIMNRSNSKANELATELNIISIPFDCLTTAVNKADIIIVSTQASNYLITQSMIDVSKERYFYDLSIPNNIDTQINILKNQHLKNVDDLSKINDETFANRRKEVPKALKIIEEHKAELKQWLQLRKYAPLLHSLKRNLIELKEVGDKIVHEEEVERTIKKIATEIREKRQPTCFYMQTVHEFISRN
ncbi:MAG TPA: glutamyl-tRNA reductase [Sediminibacterium sp.]|uniref:glutamyl-tRNA reductase n=1 Tax=Sediminibacterium sp. TaxID=1917865 RepID=UPI0008D22D0D|nr:glutamyl-tRNA reductase [Sediminibacterium sp.]OHC85847.1 MAG: glutamyl-tRNA reductase [Sphingobacteriia bacterium RIFOXYC2_FULL_35_18]OHC87382.1 MAG: glutamyl-tRNA reductase [Sphingobacteriia bacterium RIFOXYD2_FULL_35_12]HLD52492.1 glutamyl-tRNA reductase [Sediminibacterium sp.]